MPSVLNKSERDGSRLYLRVLDSGRTWLIQYNDIERIPWDMLAHGDVLIVRNGSETGVMFMQALSSGSGHFKLEDVGRPLYN